jgi:hypothetical protein
MTMLLAPGRTTLAQLETIYRDKVRFELTPESLDAVRVGESRLADRLKT